MWRAERRLRDPARIASYQFALFGAPSPPTRGEFANARTLARVAAVSMRDFFTPDRRAK